MNTKCLVSTSIPARLDTLVYWEPFSWFTSVGTTRNTVIRLGWSRIGLAVLILHAAGVGLTDRLAVISGRYNKYHPLTTATKLLRTLSATATHTHTHIHANTSMRNWSWEWSWISRHCMLAVYAGRGTRNPVWSGKEAHWSLRRLIVKLALWCRL